MKEPVLLIIGSIDVSKNTPFMTHLVATEDRKQQYFDSIEFAINNYQTINNIVFSENTNFQYNYSKLKQLAQKKGKELEVLSFVGDSIKTQEQGKGYGEGEAIKYTLVNSQLLKKSKSFIKLTGRLKIANFDNVFSPQKENCFHRAYYGGSVCTVIYKTNIDFYNTYLLDVYKNVQDRKGIFLEHIFFENLKNNKGINSFNNLPCIMGVSGSTGTNYSHNYIRKTRLYFNLGLLNLNRNLFSEVIVLGLKFMTKIKSFFIS